MKPSITIRPAANGYLFMNKDVPCFLFVSHETLAEAGHCLGNLLTGSISNIRKTTLSLCLRY